MTYINFRTVFTSGQKEENRKMGGKNERSEQLRPKKFIAMIKVERQVIWVPWYLPHFSVSLKYLIFKQRNVNVRHYSKMQNSTRALAGALSTQESGPALALQ